MYDVIARSFQVAAHDRLRRQDRVRMLPAPSGGVTAQQVDLRGTDDAAARTSAPGLWTRAFGRKGRATGFIRFLSKGF